MGMFDDLIYKGKKYQTKSLARVLDQYEIRNDGTLWREISRYENVPPEEQTTISINGADIRIPFINKIPTGWEQVKLTGEVKFYWYKWSNEEQKVTEKEEYSAYFVHGQLKELHNIEEDFEIEPVTPVPEPDEG